MYILIYKTIYCFYLNSQSYNHIPFLLDAVRLAETMGRPGRAHPLPRRTGVEKHYGVRDVRIGRNAIAAPPTTRSAVPSRHLSERFTTEDRTVSTSVPPTVPTFQMSTFARPPIYTYPRNFRLSNPTMRDPHTPQYHTLSITLFSTSD